MPLLSFIDSSGDLLVTGRTFDIKEQIKIFGGKWSPARRGWIFSSSEKCTDEMRAELEAAAAASRPIPAVPMTVERAIALKVETGAYYWVCCDQCRVVNWESRTSSCKVHAFRAGGKRFTGD